MASAPSFDGGAPSLIIVMGVSGSGKSTLAEALARALDVPYADADDLHSPENIAKMSRGIPLGDRDRYPWLETVRQMAEDFLHPPFRSPCGDRMARPNCLVVACSALKRHYRSILRGAVPTASQSQFPSLRLGNLASPSTSFDILDPISAEDDMVDCFSPPLIPYPFQDSTLPILPISTNRTRAKPIRTYFVYINGLHSLLLTRISSRESHFMKAKMLDSQIAALELPDPAKEPGVVWVSLAASTKIQVQQALQGLLEQGLTWPRS